MTKEELNKLIELLEKAKENNVLVMFDKYENHYYIEYAFEDSDQILIKIKPE